LCAGRHSNEYTLALALATMRLQSGEHIVPRRVEFANPRPASVADHVAFFGTEAFAFDGAANRLVFDPSTYALPTGTSDPALLRVLDAYAENLVVRAGPPTSLEERLENAISMAFQDGEPSLDAIASTLKVSRRTLQRRLADSGTSFQGLVDCVRR